MNLLFLNAIKGIMSKKIQVVAIILLIAISTTLYVSANVAINQVKDGYYNYLKNQKVEHFSFYPSFELEEFKKIDLDLLNGISLTDEEKMVIKQVSLCLETECSEQTLLILYSVFVKYNKHLELNLDKVEAFAQEKEFDYQIETSKLRIEGDNYYKAIPYLEKKINIPYLLEGKFPEKDDEITILPNYASANQLVIGDDYVINDITYKIVGFAFLPDHIYPILSINVPVFKEETNNIMLMNENTYNQFIGIEEKIYVGRYQTEIDFRNRNIFEEEGIYDQEVIEYGMASFLRFARTDAIQGDLEPNEIFTNIFVNVLLAISAVMIIIIVKKRIESEKNQVGILKALGYGTFKISISYLIYPIVGAVLGSLIGYYVGVVLSKPLVDVYISFYNVPLQEHQITFDYINRVFLMPIIFLSIVSFITAFVMIRKPSLFLLKEGSHLKVNFLTKFTNKLLRKRSFKTRFKYSLAFRSLGKLLIVSFVAFASGLLITLFMIGNGLFNGLLDQAFGSMKFDYVVNYNTFLIDQDEEADLFFTIDHKVEKIISNGKEKEIEEKIEITLFGVDQDLKYLEVRDEKEELLISKVKDNNVLISKRIAELNQIELEDQIFLKLDNQLVAFQVAGIYQDYFGRLVFIDRSEMSTLYGFDYPIYNAKYTNNQKYQDTTSLDEEEIDKIAGVFSIKDLEENIRKEMEAFDYVIYVIIIFAAIMAFIIMLVIANVVVEENKKNISLMKVLGYKNKEIGAIVLNIYTPFIIVSYILSVPAMVYLVKYLLDRYAGDIGFVIPVEISLVQTGIGLIALLVAYYLGIGVSKRVLNKISLSEALKRE